MASIRITTNEEHARMDSARKELVRVFSKFGLGRDEGISVMLNVMVSMVLVEIGAHPNSIETKKTTEQCTMELAAMVESVQTRYEEIARRN